MNVELGARVRTSDGEEVGTIDQVVLDASSGAVRAAVVRQGFILGRDVEVPLAMLEPGPHGEVLLTCTAAELDGLPTFVEERYTAAADARAAAAGYPAGRVAWPVGGAGMDTTPAGASEGRGSVWREIEVILDRQHFENAVVGEGSEVRSHDGERIGAVERLSFDEESGRLAELVVRSGFIVVEELAVPAQLVAAVDDGVVVLGLDAAALAAWADLTEDDEVWSRDGVHLGTIRRWGMDYLIIRGLEGGRWLRVPMTAVARREDRRIVLHVEAAEALRWDTLAGAAAGPAEPGR